MSICTRYEKNKDDAESLLNQSFLKILMGMDKYKKEIPFKLWIRKITINTIIDDFRKNNKLKKLTVLKDFQNEYDHEGNYDINEYIKKINAAEIYNLITKLPDMNQKVFNLFVVDGFSHKEISELLNIPSGTSRWLLNSAKEELKINILKPTNKSQKTIA
ncbi:MAG: RNA polymerase sigma factor [Sphingobacteriaceae bacterium]|nr:RNA polymerase sigma factor [Sphingobacteriaceae bacterium]